MQSELTPASTRKSGLAMEAARSKKWSIKAHRTRRLTYCQWGEVRVSKWRI